MSLCRCYLLLCSIVLLIFLLPQLSRAQMPAPIPHIPVDSPDVISLGDPPVEMAPVEPLLELLHARMTTDEQGKITITRNEKTFTFTLDDNQAAGNDAAVTLALAPFKLKGATYTPLQPFIKALGGTCTPDKAHTFVHLSLHELGPLSLPYERGNFLSVKVENGKACYESFHGADHRYTQLYIMNSDGSDLHRISYHRRVAHLPSFSADGERWVAFSEGLGIPFGAAQARTRKSGQMSSVVFPCCDAKLSPNGSTIVYEWFQNPLGDEGVWICSVPFGGGKWKRLAEGEKPGISPDSRTITFLAKYKGKSDLTPSVMDMNGKHLQPFGDCVDSRFSPDGRMLLVLREIPEKKMPREEDADADLLPAARLLLKTKIITYRLEPDGKLKKLVTKVAQDGISEDNPLFTPDSRQIVFTRRGQGIFIMNPDRSGLRQLTTGGTDSVVGMPDASHLLISSGERKFRVTLDGKNIALQTSADEYCGADRGFFINNGQICRRQLDSGEVKQLTKDLQVQEFTLSPDGQRIFFLAHPQE